MRKINGKAKHHGIAVGFLPSAVAVAAVIIIVIMGLAGCSDKIVPSGLVGIWSCGEMASDGTTPTGFYAMYVNSDGTFSLYDTCGNPGISGTLSASEDGQKGTVKLKCESDDFDPPMCWDIDKKAELDYELLEKGQMRLGYKGVWLNFYDEYTHEIFQFQLANRSYPEYKWEMKRSGEGRVKIERDKVYDEDAGFWGIYKLTAEKPGNLNVTMRYSNGEKIMYTVSFDLTVNEDGTIRENDRDGDIDEAMTS